MVAKPVPGQVVIDGHQRGVGSQEAMQGSQSTRHIQVGFGAMSCGELQLLLLLPHGGGQLRLQLLLMLLLSHGSSDKQVGPDPLDV